MRVVDAKEKRPLAFFGVIREKNRKMMDSQSARISNARRSMTAFEGLGRGDSFNGSFFNIVVGHCHRDSKNEEDGQPQSLYGLI